MIRSFNAKSTVTALVAAPSSDSEHGLFMAGTSRGAIAEHRVATDECTTIIDSLAPIADLSVHRSMPRVLAAAADSDVLLLDARGKSRMDPQALFRNSADIGSLEFNHSGTYLSLTDDEGSVSILDLRKCDTPVFRHWLAHDNICMAADWGSWNTAWEYWTGGFDYFVKRWDYSIGSCSESFNVQDILNSNPDRIQMLNPPFVNALKTSPTGAHVAAALGDGSIALFTRSPAPASTGSFASNNMELSNINLSDSQSKKKKKRKPVKHSATSVSVHSWSCTTLEFLQEESNSFVAGPTVLSGGLNGKLAVTKFNNHVQRSEKDNPLSQKFLDVGRKLDCMLMIDESNVLVGGVSLDDQRHQSANIDLWSITSLLL